jgi:hypothetical protein
MRDKKSITLQSRQVFKYHRSSQCEVKAKKPAFCKTTRGGGKERRWKNEGKAARRDLHIRETTAAAEQQSQRQRQWHDIAWQCPNALAKTGSLVLGLLEPRLKLLLSHLQVLDVGSGTVQERNFARLLVGDEKGVLQAAVAIPELIASPVLRLDTLAMNFLVAAAKR